MMSVNQQAQDFFNSSDGLSDEELKSSLKNLSSEVRAEYYKLKNAKYFIPENLNTEGKKEYLSPSGKYKLTTTPCKTKEGCWNYTQGLVFNSDQLITEVQRNYSSFPFAWVENHPNGHDYLVCGENYQGQTVIELDTGKRVDYLPQDANLGAGSVG